MTSEPRFFIDHGVIHDRATGKHVVTDGEPPFEDGIEQVCELLNGLVLQAAAVSQPEVQSTPSCGRRGGNCQCQQESECFYGAAQAVPDSGALPDWQKRHLDRLLDALRDWRNEDHEDAVTLARSDVCALLDGFYALESSAAVAQDAVNVLVAGSNPASPATSPVPSAQSRTPIIEPIESVGMRGANKQAHAEHASMFGGTNFCGHGMMASICPTCSVPSTHQNTAVK